MELSPFLRPIQQSFKCRGSWFEVCKEEDEKEELMQGVSMSFLMDLHWGTKVLTHCYKVALFCIVVLSIPSPCVPHLLAPKSMLCFRPSSLTFITYNIDSGVGEFRAFKRTEIKNEWNCCIVELVRCRQVCQLLLSLFCPYLLLLFEPATSHSTVKHSIDWACPATV